MARAVFKDDDVCTTCGQPIGYKYHRNQKRCISCIMSEPYDFTYTKGKCKIQLHTELMTKTHLIKLISGLGRLDGNEKKE